MDRWRRARAGDNGATRVTIVFIRTRPDLLPLLYAAYHGISREQADREISTAMMLRERAKSGRPLKLTYTGLATG